METGYGRYIKTASKWTLDPKPTFSKMTGSSERICRPRLKSIFRHRVIRFHTRNPDSFSLCALPPKRSHFTVTNRNPKIPENLFWNAVPLLPKPQYLIRYKLFRLAHPYSEPNSFGMSLPSKNGKSWACTTAYSQITKESGGSFKLHAGPWVANAHPAHPLEFFFFLFFFCNGQRNSI